MARPPESYFEFSWPKDRPLPTDAEWAVAETRHRDFHAPYVAKGDFSDGSVSLSHMVATYAPFVWWQFFWPEEGAEMQRKAMDELYARLSVGGGES